MIAGILLFSNQTSSIYLYTYMRYKGVTQTGAADNLPLFSQKFNN